MNELLSGSHRAHHSSATSNATHDALAWFDLGQVDRDQAARLGPISDQVADQIIEEFYAHILRFDNAAQKFTSKGQIEQVKAGQKKYFTDLISAEFDDAYVADRRRIGGIHEVAGITPTLYIGSYAYYLHRLGTLIGDMMAEDPATAFRLFLSLAKIAHFDMALALETYVETREATIERQQRLMSELPTPVLKLKQGLLLIPVVGMLDRSRARSLTVSLLEGIRQFHARAVVLDITGVADVDSSVANHLIQSMQAARLMGARSILTGVSSDVAQSLVKIGVIGADLNTAGDLESGIIEAEAILAR
ncbi:protoglobin domain-containing protein [Pararhodobacter zhoushanensis]|uniref:Protoglobin domain-containing protein n=1 Tax=Pararhodobacter zhoushanensis TaxID=2479545 RepID=A0ABT3H2A3_9RHOB|nr:protoglobin domain-containing protein [Pararhodobacter zhoushanensis]MCW1933917.1 protoglobin domain-containing protein [Pararhodobacter zhoushanensis]